MDAAVPSEENAEEIEGVVVLFGLIVQRREIQVDGQVFGCFLQSGRVGLTRRLGLALNREDGP